MTEIEKFYIWGISFTSWYEDNYSTYKTKVYTYRKIISERVDTPIGKYSDQIYRGLRPKPPYYESFLFLQQQFPSCGQSNKDFPSEWCGHFVKVYQNLFISYVMENWLTQVAMCINWKKE